MIRSGFHIPDDACLVDSAPDPEWLDPSCDSMRDEVEFRDGRVLVVGTAPIDPGWDTGRRYAWIAVLCPCGVRTEAGECEQCAKSAETRVA